MERKTKRRLSVLVGVFLLVVSGAVVAVLRGALFDRPVLAVQVGAVGIAGVLDVLAGFDTRLTERFRWYRLSGLGNIFLGISLPFGLVDTTHTLPLLLTVLGGLSLAAMGIDMLLFDGRHVYSEPLGETDS